jgi:hypothetical protein
LGGGDLQTVAEGAVLLTSLVVAETTGAAVATVAITDKDAGAQLYLAAPAGDTVVWCPCEPVAVNGLVIACQTGAVVVSYSLR